MSLATRSSTLGSCSLPSCLKSTTLRSSAHLRGGVEQGASGIVIQPNGRIVATGSSGPHEFGDDTIPRFVLIRRLADGHRDTSFGVKGEVTTFFEGGARAHGSAVDADGRIVVVGGSGEGSIGSFALARYIV